MFDKLLAQLNIRRLHQSVIVSLISCFTFLIFRHLGNHPLLSWDEAIYAQVAKQSSDPLAFHWLGNLNNGLWFEKPPLMIWLVKVAYLAFGINEFSARVWPAMFALGTIILTYFFVKILTDSKKAAILSIAAFFAFSQFLLYSNILQLDMAVGFFILLALYFFLEARLDARYYIGFWLAVGLGLMTKNAIGLFPLVIILISSIVANQFSYLRNKYFLYGFGSFLIIVLPWHVIETLRFGESFWNNYFFYHVFQRFTSTLENNGGSKYYYLDLFRQNYLLILIFPSLTAYLYRSYKREFAYILVLTAFLFPLIIFSAAQTKSYSYILIIYPYFAIMTGTSLAWLFDKLTLPAFKNFVTCLLAAAFVFTGWNYSIYMSIKLNGLGETDAKAIGEYLKDHFTSQNIVYVQLRTATEVVNAYPAIIYYSERPVTMVLESPAVFDKSQIRLNTPTHRIYTNGQTVFIVAVRAGL